MDNGRPGYSSQSMFKYLILKVMYNLSDRGVVKRAKTDLAFKYFLDLAPEDEVIDTSSLTKFRKLRLKDDAILNTLIAKSVEIALKNGIKLSNTLIIDSTHTETRFNNKSPRDYLLDLIKKLRKEVYQLNEEYVDKMPSKTESNTGHYEDAISYCKKIVDLIKSDETLMARPNIVEEIDLIEETIDNINDEINYSKDKDAKVGHKTADTSFFGYKTHIAMTPERLIVSATVTTVEKHDGKELETLVKNAKDNGVSVDSVVGDGAYS